MATTAAATGWAAMKAAGNAHYSGGRTDAAIEQYSAALGDAELPQVDRATILCNRAQCYLKLGNNAAAIEDCTACLTIQPDNMKALFRRGSALEAMNDKKAALKDFRDALKVNPSLADAAMAVRRLEAALGETPSRAGAAAKGGKGGGAAVTEEDMRQLEETKQRVKDVALQKVKAKQQQEVTAKEKRSIDLTLSQIEGLPPAAGLYRPIGKMFMASPREEMASVLQGKRERAEAKLKVCASALEHIERQEREADAAFLEVYQGIARRSGSAAAGAASVGSGAAAAAAAGRAAAAGAGAGAGAGSA